MGACFVTDMGTALALSAIFITANLWFSVFIAVSVALIVALPKLAPWFFRRYGDRVIEPEIKLVFVCLFVLMVLADASKGHAVLPTFILGLVMARHYQQHRQEQERLRVVAFAFLTPFFFLKGGLNVSLGAVFANWVCSGCCSPRSSSRSSRSSGRSHAGRNPTAAGSSPC
jgi:Kef-type K+ transport system membrane component KefB